MLIALAIVVTKQCGCMASHARGTARKGATPEEVAEALGVAILMNGGPGTVHATRAFGSVPGVRETVSSEPVGEALASMLSTCATSRIDSCERDSRGTSVTCARLPHHRY